MSSTRKYFNDLVGSAPVVIFVRDRCRYCVDAKRTISEAFRRLGVDPVCAIRIVHLDHMGTTGQRLSVVVASATGRSTVPNIFVGGRNVGGNDELQKFVCRNKLFALLQQAL